MQDSFKSLVQVALDAASQKSSVMCPSNVSIQRNKYFYITYEKNIVLMKFYNLTC